MRACAQRTVCTAGGARQRAAASHAPCRTLWRAHLLVPRLAHLPQVKPGPDGYRAFTEAIRRAFSLPEDSELNITFTCDEPSTGQC